MAKTLRLLLPQWQGGVNPDYAFGAELLNFIAPKSDETETVRINVAEDFEAGQVENNGLVAEQSILTQITETQSVLEEKQPNKLIVFGGDCSIDYAPFDYLHGKYGNKLGLIWLDAHSDLIESGYTNHAHETIVADLLGRETTTLSRKLNHPFKSKQVLYVGLPREEMRPQDYLVDELNIPIISPEVLAETSQPVLDWIEENNFEHIAVHFDLDVLSPDDFRSILPAEPHSNQAKFGAAIGRMTLKQVVRFLNDIDKKAELTGLGIAEHMPWDAINLHKALSEISIFN